MKTYCLSCRKHTDNIGSKKVTMTNKVIRENNKYHNTIKMKPIDVKSNSYGEYNVDSNAKDPKFKIGDHVRISKYKNIFAKGYAPNWSE